MRFPLRQELRKLLSLARFLQLQRIKGFSPPGEPLLDDETVGWITPRLKSTRLFLEFGSGGSTLLANQLGIPSISVESDRFYASAVRSVLPNPLKAQIVTPRMGVTGEWGMPVFFKSRKGSRYVRAAFANVGTDFPDFILVDGRYRVACVLEAARRAARRKQYAVVLLDDYEGRTYYHLLERFLGTPERIGRAAKFVVGQTAVLEETVQAYMNDPR